MSAGKLRVPEKLMEKQQMSSEQVDEKWDTLKRAMDQIYAKNSSTLSFQTLYTLSLLCVIVYVCVLVCGCFRERERGIFGDLDLHVVLYILSCDHVARLFLCVFALSHHIKLTIPTAHLSLSTGTVLATE